MENIAFTLDIIGKIMIAYTALSVHGYISREHRIDGVVFGAMKRERFAGVLGILFMIAAYVIHISL